MIDESLYSCNTRKTISEEVKKGVEARREYICKIDTIGTKEWLRNKHKEFSDTKKCRELLK